MGRGYLVVEGHGEERAALNLVTRLWQDLSLSPLHFAAPIRGPALHTRSGIEKAVELVRRKRDVEALLVLRDEDDACPKQTAPLAASWLGSARLPFPAALVLFRREYESLLLPSVHRMAGVPLREGAIERPGIREGVTFAGDVESIRDAKGWLSARYAAGAYKPTVDQLLLTRLVAFEDLRAARVPSFCSLERALRFLDGARGRGGVYPTPAAVESTGGGGAS